jgi:hypothetical protein
MSFTPLDNTATLDDFTVSFPQIPQAADKNTVVTRLKRAWDGVVAEVKGLGGLTLQKPDLDEIADVLIKSGTHAVIFELVLTKAEFRLNIDVDKVTFKAGSVRVPTDLEGYRSFLSLLNGWSSSTKNIVPDADYKDFNAKNPKKPTVYKDFDEMVKKSKSDLEDFRNWAKKCHAKGDLDEIDKTAKLKPSDPARVKALKAINTSLKEYYDSF